MIWSKLTEFLTTYDDWISQAQVQFINQYLRGQIFFWIDNILVTDVNYTEKEIEEILKFLIAYIKFSVKFLQNFPSLLHYVQ